jgi:hypothetical protein
MKIKIWILINLLGALASFVKSDSLPLPSSEYSGVREIRSEQGLYSQSVYYAMGKERVETRLDNMALIMIQRPDKQLAWQLMPHLKMYRAMSLKLGKEMTGTPPDDFSIELVGEEMVEGLPCRKYKLLMKDKSAGGFIWFTAQNIPLKMDFISREGTRKTRYSMTLKNLQMGKQASDLFEIPASYKPLPVYN